MISRTTSLLLALLLVTGTLVLTGAPGSAAAQEAPPAPAIRVGYGEADATWNVGAGAGQYADDDPDNVSNSASSGNVDPHASSLKKSDSYGVQSRLSYRAIVVEEANGEDQAVFVKSDSYLAQDYLQRRVAQILALEGSSIAYDEIFHMASHNHSSPYYMSPSAGVWIFQDVFDIRAFEYHARAMAQAILDAEDALAPARMGATTIEHKLFKGVIQKKGFSDDGTPRGYPDDFGDFGLSVLRFDNIEDPANPLPIATLINWGQHPEGLDGYGLLSGEFIAPLERFVERATGAPVVFGQGDVGSSEQGPGHRKEVADLGIPTNWNHVGFAQTERGAFLLASDVIKAWTEIGDPQGNPLVPFSSNFDVEAGDAWVAGPYSHPYPSVANCRTETTVEGAPGAPGPPECLRAGDPDPDNQLWEELKKNGVQLPDNYDLPSYGGLEENTRIHLQAFKLGDVIIASCACEAQVDIILNFESRANDVEGDFWDGYDWTQRMNCYQNADTTWTCEKKADDPRPYAVLGKFTVSDYRYKRMLAQIHNDAAGWDDPENIDKALSEPYEPSEILGNFTKEELTEDTGYKLAIGVGHAGDYNGYTVSYREYQSWDDYRKSLTSYGPHTADYMSTRMVRLAGTLNGVPSEELEMDINRGLPDEARQVAMSTALGVASQAAYEAWRKALPVDVMPDEQVISQPKDIKRFDATTFSWYGGSNASDNPTVTVERKVDGEWEFFADQSGEIQTRVEFPNGIDAYADTYTGQQSWQWTANFEAFDALPAAIGNTPSGEYRFVVDGNYRSAPTTDTRYHLESAPFEVSPWDGIVAGDLSLADDGSVSLANPTVTYPATYSDRANSPFLDYLNLEKKGQLIGEQFCTRCSFRPWAFGSRVVAVTVTVVDDAGNVLREVPATLGADGRWRADTNLYRGESAFIAAGGIKDANGEINGVPSKKVVSDREVPVTVSATSIELTPESARSGQYGDGARLQARLTTEGAPLPDRLVEFQLGGRVIEAMTDAEGLATVATTLVEEPGTYPLSVRFAGEESVYEASATGPIDFIVERENTFLVLTSDGKGSKLQLTATLSEDGLGVARRTVDFFAGDDLIGSAVTNEAGTATMDVPGRYRGGKQEYRAVFSGDRFYEPSAAGPI